VASSAEKTLLYTSRQRGNETRKRDNKALKTENILVIVAGAIFERPLLLVVEKKWKMHAKFAELLCIQE
jgi:hypothetical protein